MTYTVEKQIDTTYTSVGRQLYEVPSSYPTDPIDEPDTQGLVLALNDIFTATSNLTYVWDWETIQSCPEVFRPMSNTVTALACKLECWDLSELPDEF